MKKTKGKQEPPTREKGLNINFISLISQLHPNVDPQYAEIDPSSRTASYAFKTNGPYSPEYSVHRLASEGAILILKALLPPHFEIELKDDTQVTVNPPKRVVTTVNKLERTLEETGREVRGLLTYTGSNIDIVISYRVEDEDEFNNIREFLESVPEDSGRKPKKGQTRFCYD